MKYMTVEQIVAALRPQLIAMEERLQATIREALNADRAERSAPADAVFNTNQADLCPTLGGREDVPEPHGIFRRYDCPVVLFEHLNRMPSVVAGPVGAAVSLVMVTAV
jgi:hypothetical protein